jgi:hypothetical protein
MLLLAIETFTKLRAQCISASYNLNPYLLTTYLNVVQNLLFKRPFPPVLKQF